MQRETIPPNIETMLIVESEIEQERLDRESLAVFSTFIHQTLEMFYLYPACRGNPLRLGL
jgi:hypothetical protein